MQVFGYEDHSHGGHAEVIFDDVRVPAANLIGEEGGGFAIAQARLGPGPHPPLHAADRHGRAGDRADVPAGGVPRRPSASRWPQQGVVQNWIADARVAVEQLRLLVLKTAWMMDTVGNKGAHTEIQAIKIATPRDGRSASSTRRSSCTARAASARTSRWPSCRRAPAR